MLDFCYGVGVDKLCSRQDKKPYATFLVGLFEIADKYDIPTLKTAIENRFTKFPLYLSPKEVKEDALKLIYQMPSSTTSQLRMQAMLGIADSLPDLIRTDSFQALMSAYPQMAVDILKYLKWDMVGKCLEWWKCRRCQKRYAVDEPAKDLKSDGEEKDAKYCPYCRQRVNPGYSTDIPVSKSRYL